MHVLLWRHGRDHHRRLGLAKQLTEHRTDPADHLLKPGHRHGGSSVPEALQRRQVFRRQVGVPEQHVDKGWWQEGVRNPVLLDQREELGKVGPGHDDDLTPERHDREAEHARRVGEWRERQVHRPSLERIAHQGERRHRFDVPAGQHDPLGLARRPACARNHDDVVGRIGLPGFGAHLAQPLIERHGKRDGGVQANQRRELG